MNNEATAPAEAGIALRKTTAWREWFGWICAMLWFFSMLNWYEYLMKGYSEANVYGFSLAFKLIFILSVIGFGSKFGRDPNGLAKIAHYTTPVAFLLTAGFSFMPLPLASVLYAITPVFFAPVFVRRAYGVLQTAKPGYTFTFYMLAIGVAYIPMNAFLDYCYYNDVPLIIAYAACSVFALIAWIGIRRRIGFTDNAPGLSGIKLTKSVMIFGIIVFLLACWLFKMKCIVDYTMEQFDDFLYLPVYIILPGIYYALFGYIGDKKREKPVFAGIFIAYLICLQLVFLLGNPTSTQNKLVIPLVILNHLAGNIIEYFLYIIPIYFFAHAWRPVLIAPLGVAAYLAMRAVRWALEPFFPEATHISNLTSLFPGIPQLHDLPLFVSTAVSAIVFFFLINFIYERYRERTLAASLYALLHGGAGSGAVPAVDAAETAEAAEKQSMAAAGFTRDEIEIALLLIEGLSRSEITRKLRLSSADANKRLDSIRQKIGGGSDPVIYAAAKMYKLTGSEIKVLRCLRGGMTNPQIAAELVLSENTIRSQVRSLMSKLPLTDRKQVPAWLEDFKTDLE